MCMSDKIKKILEKGDFNLKKNARLILFFFVLGIALIVTGCSSSADAPSVQTSSNSQDAPYGYFKVEERSEERRVRERV